VNTHLAILLTAPALLLAGCQTTPYDPALGRNDNLWGYRVEVGVSDPGCSIEVNGEHAATLEGTRGEIIVWGEADGRLRERQVVRIVANPVKKGQHKQVMVFRNIGGVRAPIPHRLFFDLNLPAASTDVVNIR